MLAAKEFPDKGKHRIFRYRGGKKERNKEGKEGWRERGTKEGRGNKRK